MTREVKVLATKSHDLSLVPGPHNERREPSLTSHPLASVLTLTLERVRSHLHLSVCTHTPVNKCNSKYLSLSSFLTPKNLDYDLRNSMAEDVAWLAKCWLGMLKTLWAWWAQLSLRPHLGGGSDCKVNLGYTRPQLQTK